jgi:hypothetical protein
VEGDRLLQQLEEAAPHPAVAEGHPRRPPDLLASLVAVDGLVEEGDPGLVPEQLAEEGGRVGAGGQRGAGRELGGVEGAREVCGGDAQVDLEGGVGGLGDDTGQLDVEGLGAVNDDAPVGLHRLERRRQGAVAGRLGEAAGAEVAHGEGGEGADHGDADALRRRRRGDALHRVGDAGREGGEGPPRELDGRGGALDAEATHLEGDVVVVAAERLAHGDVLGGGPAGPVHEGHLQLGADRLGALAEAGSFQQFAEGGEADAEPLREALVIGPAEALALDLTAHRSNATPNGPRRPNAGSEGGPAMGGAPRPRGRRKAPSAGRAGWGTS